MIYAYKIFLVSYLLSFTSIAHAYVGPGAGLSAIGTIIAFIVAIVLMILGFLWYPIKRLIKGKNSNSIQGKPLSESAQKKTDFEQPEQ